MTKLENDWLYKDVSDPVAAGWFEDGLASEPDYQVDFLCTPFNKVSVSDKVSKPIVLLMTAAASPIHLGHISLMEAAKKHLQYHGHNVVGGYVAVAHDSYVNTKANGTAAMPSTLRNYMAELALDTSDWLSVEPWPAFQVEADVNFSVIMERLQKYLQWWVDQNIEVVLVFGSDRAYFAKAFENRGQCVCVERPGYPLPQPSERVFVCENNHTASSTSIRNGDYTHVPQQIKSLYQNWKLQAGGKLKYLIRDDNSGDSIFKGGLFFALDECVPETLDPQYVMLDYQLEVVNHKLNGRKSLSLDPMFKGDANWETSRLFNIADVQTHSTEQVARPGSPNLSFQKIDMETGDYVLVEDDSVTGVTIARAIDSLPRANITDTILLADCIEKEYADVVDMRDFLVGSKHGGLVVKNPYSSYPPYIRVPYLWPYTNTITRASVSPLKVLEFSKRVWKLNMDYYTRHPTYISETPEEFYAWAFNICGTTMKDWCQWHLNHFKD